jgi:hypothetical protein
MQVLLRLFLLLVLSCAVLSYDLKVRKSPRGRLGVALDYSLALEWEGDKKGKKQTKRNWFFSSHITFKKEVSEITDGQLWQIAIDAYKELAPELQQYKIKPDDIPKAMGLIAVGKELILTSSQKGPISFVYDMLYDSPVKEYLALCQAVWVDDGNKDEYHRRGGKCSEVMAAHLYHIHHEDQLLLHNARVVTITNYKGDLQHTAPCGSQKVGPDGRPVSQTIFHPRNISTLTTFWKIDWGCNLFVAAQHLRPVPIDTTAQSYPLETLAGGIDKIGQIQLCGSYIENPPTT